MKWIALLIAIGSIIGGGIFFSWPMPPCTNAGLFICLNGLTEGILGLSMIIVGLIFLPLIPLANLRNHIASGIGALICFTLTLVCWGSIIFHLPMDFGKYEPVVIIIKIIQGVGFAAAGLSASAFKKCAWNKPSTLAEN